MDKALALTLGEPAGIGPDIAIAAWLRRRELKLPPFYLLGDRDFLQQRARLLGIDLKLKDVRADEVVSYGFKGKQNPTVEKKLIEMQARCRSGKLVDAKRREIRFFRVSCWGNPPDDYLEIQKRENEQLAKLKKRYTVIVFNCDPMIQ